MDYDWDTLTHIVTYGANKANMVTYAKARGVKLLQAFSGCEYVSTGNATVRAGIIKNALSYAPPPWGTHVNTNTSFDGLFFDIECGIEPCPYLYPDNVKGQVSALSCIVIK